MTGWRRAALALPLASTVVVAGCSGLPDADRPFRLPSERPVPANSTSGPASPNPTASPTARPNPSASTRPSPSASTSRRAAAGASPSVSASATDEVRAVEHAVRDYYAALNRAIRLGDLASVRSKGTPQCNCQALARAIERTRAQGRVEGALFVLRSVTARLLSANRAEASIVVDATAGRVVNTQGELVEPIRPVLAAHNRVTLVSRPNGWVVDAIDAQR